MTTALRGYLGIGSNLGDRLAYLQLAVDELTRRAGIDVVAVSRVYETAPAGGPPQDAYLNAVVAIDTNREPHDVLHECRRIEELAERVRAERWGPRTLDVDVLLVGDERLDDPDLVVPHPRMTERAFVVVPLADLDPAWRTRIPADSDSVRPAGLALTVPE